MTASLFLVFALAKGLVLIGLGLEPTLLAVWAFLWQDALVALVFGLAEAVLPDKRLVAGLYASLVAYAA